MMQICSVDLDCKRYGQGAQSSLPNDIIDRHSALAIKPHVGFSGAPSTRGPKGTPKPNPLPKARATQTPPKPCPACELSRQTKNQERAEELLGLPECSAESTSVGGIGSHDQGPEECAKRLHNTCTADTTRTTCTMHHQSYYQWH